MKGKVITVMNMKGGVGKTTVTMHLAGMAYMYSLGSKRRRVLMIDYDPQFNLSQAWLTSKRYFKLEGEGKTCLAILQDDELDVDPFTVQVPENDEPPNISKITHTIRKHKKSDTQLDLIPSTLQLIHITMGDSPKRAALMLSRFSKFIAQCRDEYDIIFIDCHPTGSILTKSSLVNSDAVVIPVSPQRYAVRGIGLMMKFISAIERPTGQPVPWILFNATPRTGFTDDEVEIRANPRFAKYCLVNSLRKYKIFSDPLEGDGFVWSSGKSYSTEAFRNLSNVAREIMGKAEAL